MLSDVDDRTNLDHWVEWYWQRETEALRPNSVLQPLFPPQISNSLAGDRIRTSVMRGRLRHGHTQSTVMWVWSLFFHVRTIDRWRSVRLYSPDMIRWQLLLGRLLTLCAVRLSLSEGHNGFLRVNYAAFLWNELPTSSPRCWLLCL